MYLNRTFKSTYMMKTRRTFSVQVIFMLIVILTKIDPGVEGGDKKGGDNVIIIGGGGGGGGGYGGGYGGGGGGGGMPLILITGGGKKKKDDQTILVSFHCFSHPLIVHFSSSMCVDNFPSASEASSSLRAVL